MWRVPPKPANDEAEMIAFRDGAEFEAWLEAHADRPAGVWLKLAKKGSGIPSLTADEAVDIGLCFGWISGQRRSLDETYYLQKYVPRRPRSLWSQVNVAKVEALTAAGRMRPSGLAEVEAAKADGRWDAAYASQRTATVPPDLAAALAASPRAARAFDALSKADRYGVIFKAPHGPQRGRARGSAAAGDSRAAVTRHRVNHPSRRRPRGATSEHAEDEQQQQRAGQRHEDRPHAAEVLREEQDHLGSQPRRLRGSASAPDARRGGGRFDTIARFQATKGAQA